MQARKVRANFIWCIDVYVGKSALLQLSANESKRFTVVCSHVGHALRI